MSRVLLTGGAGSLGCAIARLLLADPDYEVRIAEALAPPAWMREVCEIRGEGLRSPRDARAALAGCTHVIHCPARAAAGAHSTLAGAVDRCDAVLRAAIEHGVERFVYISSAMVFERAQRFPTSEDDLADCAAPESAAAFADIACEVRVRAAASEHGLAATICRPCDVYDGDGEVALLIAAALAGERPLRLRGSGEETRSPTHVLDAARGVVAALRSPQAAGEDFNIAGDEEVSLAQLAALAWEAGGHDPAALSLAPTGDPCVARRRPAVEKARAVLDFEARIGVREGIGLASSVGALAA